MPTTQEDNISFEQITNKGLLELVNKNQTFHDLLLKKLKDNSIDVSSLNQLGIAKITPVEIQEMLNLDLKISKTIPASEAINNYNQDIENGGKNIYEYEIAKIQNALKKLFPELAQT